MAEQHSPSMVERPWVEEECRFDCASILVWYVASLQELAADCAFSYAVFAFGYDGSLLAGLQGLKPWQEYFKYALVSCASIDKQPSQRLNSGTYLGCLLVSSTPFVTNRVAFPRLACRQW